MSKPLDSIFLEQNQKIRQQARPQTFDEALLLLFWIGETCFATPIERVREVVEGARTTALPLPSELYDGILNLRGNIVPILSWRSIMKEPPKEARYQRHIILETDEKELISIEVMRVSKTYLQSAPTLAHPELLQNVINIQGNPVKYLDFNSAEAKALLKSGGKG